MGAGGSKLPDSTRNGRKAQCLPRPPDEAPETNVPSLAKGLWMQRSRLLLGAIILCSGLLAACGGGGGGVSALPGTSQTASKTTGAKVRVFIPSSSGSTSVRAIAKGRPNFISSSTASISIGVYTVNGATPSPLPSPVSITIATSSDCTASTSGSTSGESCTIVVTVPVATAVVLQISSYDANGNLLGQSLTAPINTTLATIPAQSFSLGGVPASFVFAQLGYSAGDDGSSHTVPVTITALDADGNTILAPGSFETPITLTITGDTNGALSLSPTSFASPGPAGGEMTATLTYNSTIAITQATITAASGSVTASVPFAPIVISPTTLGLAYGAASTFTASEAGYSGAFTVPSGNSLLSFTCSPENCTPSSAGGTVAITVDVIENSVTTSTFTLTDAYGGTYNVPFSISSTTGGGQLVGPSYPIYKYPVPSLANPSLYGIAIGPDGQSIWYVDRTNYWLGAIAEPSACNATTCVIDAQTAGLFGNGAGVQLQAIVANGGSLYLADDGTSTGANGGTLYQLNSCTAANPNTCAVTTSLSGVAGDENFGSIDPPVQPANLYVGPDADLYVADGYPSAYDYIPYFPTTSCCGAGPGVGGVMIYDSGGTSSIYGMTADASAANLWFTDIGDQNLGYFPIPCNDCTSYEMPAGYTGGSDLRSRPLTATRAKTALRRITHPYIQRRVRDIPTGSSAISTAIAGVVSGPDGYLYVADPGNHTIDQIDPNVWDGASGSGSPCVSTACTYTAIALPQSGALPENLTVGPDGNVWFTDTTGYVGFVSLSTCASSNGCQAVEYATGGAPWGIIAGPDGNVWFTMSTFDSNRNSIGKVVLQ
jgi:hypothetical protein